MINFSFHFDSAQHPSNLIYIFLYSIFIYNKKKMNKSHVLKLKKIQPTTRTRNKTAQDKLKKKKRKR